MAVSLLGDLLREYELEYPQGIPVGRFALSNKGDKIVYLNSIRLVFRTGSRPFRDRLVLDPIEDKVLPLELAEGAANVLGQGRPTPELNTLHKSTV